MIEKSGNYYYVTGELDYLSYTIYYEMIFENDDGSTFRKPNSFYYHRPEIKNILLDDEKVNHIKEIFKKKILRLINIKATDEFEEYCKEQAEIIA